LRIEERRNPLLVTRNPGVTIGNPRSLDPSCAQCENEDERAFLVQLDNGLLQSSIAHRQSFSHAEVWVIGGIIQSSIGNRKSPMVNRQSTIENRQLND
jgi:hypothetical protein